ncbi:hypothetical protein SLEP1_g6823 [Rubroshorea leprosula]|uniref:CCHC-type domain-containing protein n=1 Tax=Rubroshorea leprosula TaxID=152421 RepID=A0AAV5I2G1_9ROSI|nr:hypothetical protein SLEP1_g6823 [Rubroshorea leprosula]
MAYSPSPPTMQRDIYMSEATQPGNLAELSYKDKLLFDENPTIVSFATTPGYMDEDSDVDDDPNDPTPIVLLSKAEKRRIREPWMNALIIKAFHSKPLGYNYVFPRVKAQWKPTEAVNSTTTTVVWARLPNLSADHYDPTTLQKIGNEVGTLLHVDAHIAHHTRGQYARGVNVLCFNCGRIGHRNNQCPRLKDKTPSIINAISNASTVSSDPKLADASNAQESETIIEDTNTKNLVAQGDAQQDCTDFGPWLFVERQKPRKKTPVIGNSSEKTMATTVPSSSRGSGAPIRKLGPKSQSGSTTNRVSQTNGYKPRAFNAEQTNVKSDVSALSGKAIQLESFNEQKFKEPQWVIKNSSKVQSVSKEPTPIMRPIFTTHITAVDFSPQPITSCAPPSSSLTQSSHYSSIFSSLCSPLTHGTPQLLVPSPKPPDLLSKGQHQDSSGLCVETDASRCFSKDSINRPSLKRIVSDHESRVVKRSQYRRGLGPYHSASNFQLSLHASSEDNQHEGQDGTSSFSVQNAPLVIYEDRNGLRDSLNPLPLPPSEVPVQGPKASIANLGLDTSPDPTGNLKLE